MKIQNLLAILLAASMVLAACGAGGPPPPESLPLPGDSTLKGLQTVALGKGQQQKVSAGEVDLRVYFDGEGFYWTQYDPATGWSEWQKVELSDNEIYIIPWGATVVAYTEPPVGTAVVTKDVVAHCHFTVEDFCLLRLVQTSLKVQWVP